MSGVEGVQGNEPHYSQEELERYCQDYQKGLSLFQQSFADYTKHNVEYHKKTQLMKVMGEALNVMNETACIVLKQNKQHVEEKLNNDFSDFKNNPTPENQKKISDDLARLQ